jgi:hypothetical protein
MNKPADEPNPNATKGIDSTTQTIPSAAKVTLDLTSSLNASGGSMARILPQSFGVGFSNDITPRYGRNGRS